MKRLVPWLVAIVMYAVKLTCRYRTHNDRRQELIDGGKSWIYGQLHAHQLGAGMFGEKGTVAMVSRSADGDMVVPLLRVFGKTIVRGSSGKARKGGATALQQLIRRVREGAIGVIAVDGPRGPRGSVQKGIGLLAQKTGMPVMPVLVVPNRRWFLAKTWDRLQIPKPFCCIDFYFGDPIFVDETTNLEKFAVQLQHVLHDLEATHDPSERQPRDAGADSAAEITLSKRAA